MGSGTVVLFGAVSPNVPVFNHRGQSPWFPVGSFDSRVGADLSVRPGKDHGVRYSGTSSVISDGPYLAILDQCKGQICGTG